MKNLIRCYPDGDALAVIFSDLEMRLHLSVSAFNPANSFASGPLTRVEAVAPAGIIHLREALRFENQHEAVEVLLFDNVPGLAWRRIIMPAGTPLQLSSLDATLEFPPDSPWGNPEAIDTFHAENIRLYQRFTIPLTADRTLAAAAEFNSTEDISGAVWAGEGNLRSEIGRSPFQPLPAMIYFLRDNDRLLLDGTLSQERFSRTYALCDRRIVFREIPKTVKHLNASPDETVIGEWHYLETARSRDLHHPYDHFLSVLENFGGDYRGGREAAHREMIWGSWNDGIFREINQDDLLKTADVLQQFFPAVKWLQIDDGYDDWDYQLHPRGRIGIGVAYSGERVSPVKFPDGMRYFTDQVRRRGLRPALWVGLSVSTQRRWYLDHPEHFVLYQQSPYFAFPDISKPVVRDILRNAFQMFIQDWGFEGIKLDFWSYFFEDEQVVIPAGNITGYQYRRWFLEMIRGLLPQDGYLQTGCDIAMGNVHLGRYVDNYRYGIDIGSGEWNNVLTNARWAAFCLNAHSGRFFIPNSDSIGCFPGLTEIEARTAINFCMATRTGVELAGWLHRNLRHPLMPYLRKCCAMPDHGANVFFGDFNFKDTNSVPLIWYFKGAHFSHDHGNPRLPVRTAGIFNWSDHDSEVSLTAASFGLDGAGSYWLKDFWSDRVLELTPGTPLRLALPPHGSGLFGIAAVSPELTVLDANFGMDDVQIAGDILSFVADDATKGELFLSRAPHEIRIGSAPVRFLAESRGSFCRIAISADDDYKK